MQKALKNCVAALAKSRPALVADHKAKLAEAAEILEAIAEVDKSTEKLNEILKRMRDEAKVPVKVSNCTNKVEIMELIAEVMAADQHVSKVNLKKEVAAKLRKRKRNLSIYSKLFDECVEEVDFTTMVTEELALAKARSNSVATVKAG